MSLKDVLTIQNRPRPASWLQEAERKLDADDFNWLMQCLKNRSDFSAGYISTTMTKFGLPVSATTINNIRKTL